MLLLIPIGMVVINTFGEGIGNAWSSITSPDGLHAIYLTLLIAAIAVPLNTIFGDRRRASDGARPSSAARRS